VLQNPVPRKHNTITLQQLGSVVFHICCPCAVFIDVTHFRAFLPLDPSTNYILLIRRVESRLMNRIFTFHSKRLLIDSSILTGSLALDVYFLQFS
jgi:hypothetical protein